MTTSSKVRWVSIQHATCMDLQWLQLQGSKGLKQKQMLNNNSAEHTLQHQSNVIVNILMYITPARFFNVHFQLSNGSLAKARDAAACNYLLTLCT